MRLFYELAEKFCSQGNSVSFSGSKGKVYLFTPTFSRKDSTNASNWEIQSKENGSTKEYIRTIYNTADGRFV